MVAAESTGGFAPADRADRARRAAVWVLVSLADGFPGRWETVFQTLVAALTLTLAMVFVIQHTQARQQAATQRKLDEILPTAGQGGQVRQEQD